MPGQERLKYTLRNNLEEDEFSYFVKYDSVHGIGVSPDTGVRISPKNNSCYVADYQQEAKKRWGIDMQFK